MTCRIIYQSFFICLICYYYLQITPVTAVDVIAESDAKLNVNPNTNTNLNTNTTANIVDPYADWVFGLIPPGQSYWTPGSSIIPPGSLLLNMLIKNEAVHLNRTLPRWAKIIDYWIIGVDDNNTDNSIQIIYQHLGHLPGHIEIVHFTGMGPTWTLLVESGLKSYPLATHGILSDADFSPMIDSLDRRLLDVRCSKHMFTIYSEDHSTHRNMDWIYRNIAHVKVERRTHQILTVPTLPQQEVMQTLIPLLLDEREGGYGDRSGVKDQRYIAWLEADLIDYPDDPRTLYYLGYAHLNLFLKHVDNDWHHLEVCVEYLNRRINLPSDIGNKEERWFALLKLAEIHERYYQLWITAERYYNTAIILDGERADAHFYIGQHYRLVGEYNKALPYLTTAATLTIPTRSLFQWVFLYTCIAKLEYAECAIRITDVSNTQKLAILGKAKQLLSNNNKDIDCTSDENKEKQRRSLQQEIQTKIELRKKRKKNKSTLDKSTQLHENADDSHVTSSMYPDHIRYVSDLITFLIEDVQPNLSSITAKSVSNYMSIMSSYVDDYIGRLTSLSRTSNNELDCRRYRRSFNEYLLFFKSRENELKHEMTLNDDVTSPDNEIDIDDLFDRWKHYHQRLRALCR